MPSIEEWGNKSEDECRLGDNLTNNTDQPNRRFSDDTPPAAQPPPENATTGCTTLPPCPVPTPEELPQDQQSGIDPQKFREDFAFIDDPYYGLNPPPPHRSESPITPADLDPLRILRAQATEKDPPVTEPTAFQDFVAGLPGDPTGTTLADQVLALTAQNQALQAQNESYAVKIMADTHSIRELRGANTSLLRRMNELQDKNRQIAKERSALTAALQIANETMRISIEKIASLLRVIK